MTPAWSGTGEGVPRKKAWGSGHLRGVGEEDRVGRLVGRETALRRAEASGSILPPRLGPL